MHEPEGAGPFASGVRAGVGRRVRAVVRRLMAIALAFAVLGGTTPIVHAQNATPAPAASAPKAPVKTAPAKAAAAKTKAAPKKAAAEGDAKPAKKAAVKKTAAKKAEA